MSAGTLDRIRDAVGEFGLDEHERAAGSELLAVLIHGEKIAMQGAKRQSAIAPHPSDRRFLRQQARHELFHAMVFQSALEFLRPRTWQAGPIPTQLAALRQEGENACRRGDFVYSLLVQQVYLEGLGQVMLERLDGELSRINRLNPLRRLILAQEAEHHAFGLRMFEKLRVPDSPDAQRIQRRIPALDQMLADLLGQLEDALNRLDGDTYSYARAFRATLPGWLDGLA